MCDGEPESPSTIRHSRFLGRKQHAWDRQMAQEEETWHRHGYQSCFRFLHIPSLHAVLGDTANQPSEVIPGAFLF